jgi:hypothetical protein
MSEDLIGCQAFHSSIQALALPQLAPMQRFLMLNTAVITPDASTPTITAARKRQVITAQRLMIADSPDTSKTE